MRFCILAWMRIPIELTISKRDRQRLRRWLRSTTLPQGQVTRAKIVLSLSDGMTPSEVAAAQHVSAKTVHKWRNRFVADGPDGLVDHPRSGRPRVIDGKTVKRVLQLTTEYVPEEATHWSVRLMAKYADLSCWQVRQIWAAADLKPHRIKTFKQQ